MTSTMTRIAPAPVPKSRGFATDIEGLRAVAVTAVVAFHASVPFVTGGYVGVDVFFVISGYLITGLLLRETYATGRIDFYDFYARRMRRILPSASVVLILTMAAAVFVLSPLAVYHAAKDILFAAFYGANWNFIAQGTDYLAHTSADSPVLHYWSLAVEEQFYLVWPLLIVGAAFLARRWPVKRTTVVFAVLGGVSVASFVYSLVLTANAPTTAYLSTFTRGWEFGAGALLSIAAYVRFPARARGIALRVGPALGWAGVVALVASCFVFDGSTPFPGTAAVLPTLGTVAIIAGGRMAGTGRGTIGWVLSNPVLRYIGRLSFTWYLVHWPVLILTEAVTGTLPWPLRVVLMIAAFGLAALISVVIEQPLMRSRTLKLRRSSAIAIGVFGLVLSSAFPLALGTTEVQALASNAGAAPIVTSGNFDAVFGVDNGSRAGSTTPSALNAPADKPTPAECLIDQGSALPATCVIGPATGLRVLLFGDSHANQWAPAVEKVAAERDWQLTIRTKSGCPVAALAARNDGGRFSQPDCYDWRAAVIAEAQNGPAPQLIIVSSLSSYLPDQTEMLTSWDATLDQLRTTGAPIVDIRDTPNPTDDIPTCVSGSLDDWSKCALQQSSAMRPDPVSQKFVKGEEPGVYPVDLTTYFCDGTVCPAVKNGLLIYRDASHITATVATAMTPVVEAAIDASGAMAAVK